ncbi:sensor histidine kinase [Salegentibacter chungangensis]|uniref:Sensor histidine kinase n=1 Tax=Salegentibacter chungangensis TaxID=1335724 RepID=A0ABW3NPI1_9FLAO
MTKKQEITYHIIFWALFILMDVFFNFVIKDTLPQSLEWHLLHLFFFILLQAIIFYLNYSLIAPVTIPKRKWKYLILSQLLVIGLFTGLRFLFEEVIIYNLTGIHNYKQASRAFGFYLFDNSYYALRVIILALIFYMVKHVLNTNQRMNELKLQKKKAELQNLKAQLSPHFLFNTLNSFYSDLYDKAPETSNDILKLSEMLRYVTYENEQDQVTLKDEVTFLQNYIDLYQRRFDNKAHIKVSFPQGLTNRKIPSLLLIHFIENAFKHGILTDKEHPVIIKLETRNDRLILSTENAFKENTNYDRKGIGYKNIQKRLDLLFRENYRLDIEEQDDYFKVKLDIPLL